MAGKSYSFTDADFSAYIRTVQDEYGLGWLQKKVDKAQRLGRWQGLQPVIRGWSRAREIWETHTLPRSEMDQSVAVFALLAADLNIARSLPNYQTSVLPRLKGVDYDKAQYEVHIAAEAVRSGYTVEFVPVSSKQGEQTPDIRASSEHCEIYLECKRKDEYRPSGSAANEAWDELQTRLFSLSDEFLRNRQLIILSLGNLEQRDIEPIIHGAQQLVSEGRIGFYSHKVAGTGLAIHELVIPKANMMPIPDEINPSVMQATHRIDEDGNSYFADPRRVALYRIDSHRLSSILQSFNTARGQIAKGSIGIICIDVDVTHVHFADIDTYLQLVGNAVAHWFTPTDNTRVGAVLVSAGPSLVPVQQGNRVLGQIIFHRYAVRNPFSALSDQCKLPGEQ